MDAFAGQKNLPSIKSQSGESRFHLLGVPSCIFVLAVIVKIIEYRRRARTLSQHSSFQDRVRQLFRQLLPELLILECISASAVLLRFSYEEPGLENDDTWRDLKREWPILITADSLLGFQAMLRFGLLLSASFRRTSAISSPFEGETAAFFLFAGLARMLLLMLSPQDVYHLDGPLGGATYVAFESATCALLLPFGCRVFLRGFRQVVSLLAIVAGMMVIATRHHFALAGPGLAHLDMLFTLVMLLEMWAGIAFLFRSSHSVSNQSSEPFSSFAHIILPIQQTLPTYFLLVAFAPPFHVEPSLVGAGRPFELLQSTGLAQIAMYALAAFLHFVPVGMDKDRDLHVFTELVAADEIPPSDECVICLGSCEDNCMQKQCWRRLPCGHHFHEACIFQWLKKVQRCPVCRRHLDDKHIPAWSRHQLATSDAREQDAAGTDAQMNL